MCPIRMTQLPYLLSPPVSIPRQCKQGAALWTVLQLNDSYDLEKHLDISQVRQPSGAQWDPLSYRSPLFWSCLYGGNFSFSLRSPQERWRCLWGRRARCKLRAWPRARAQGRRGLQSVWVGA